jgi:hypothetical protein
VRALVLGLSLGAVSAQAGDVKVPAQAEVVFASTRPGTVDPALAPMQAKLGARVKYLTLRSVSTTRLELSAARSTLSLPNRKTAELTLVHVKDNVAQVKVKLPPLDATYSLGKEKSLYVQAGPHEGGELWLVVSQPR